MLIKIRSDRHFRKSRAMSGVPLFSDLRVRMERQGERDEGGAASTPSRLRITGSD